MSVSPGTALPATPVGCPGCRSQGRRAAVPVMDSNGVCGRRGVSRVYSDEHCKLQTVHITVTKPPRLSSRLPGYVLPAVAQSHWHSTPHHPCRCYCVLPPCFAVVIPSAGRCTHIDFAPNTAYVICLLLDQLQVCNS